MESVVEGHQWGSVKLISTKVVNLMILRDGPLMIWGSLGHRIRVEFFFLAKQLMSSYASSS